MKNTNDAGTEAAAGAGIIPLPQMWLALDGAPRSGTTALLNALNRHGEVFLAHEVVEHALWQAAEGFHALSRRLRHYKNVGEHVHHIPREADLNPVLLACLAYSVAGKTPRITGTKDPEGILHPDTALTDGMVRRSLHITRNPVMVMNSTLKRLGAAQGMGGDAFLQVAGDGLERVAALCIRYWNRACQGHARPDMAHLFYEDIAEDRDGAAAKVGAFLGIGGFALDSWAPPEDAGVVEAAAENARKVLGDRATLLTATGLLSDWGRRHDALAARQPMAMLYAPGTEVSFANTGQGWQYLDFGFHTPGDHGTWITEEVAGLHFAFAQPPGGALRLRLNFHAAAGGQGITRYVVSAEAGNRAAELAVNVDTPGGMQDVTLPASALQAGPGGAAHLTLHLRVVAQNSAGAVVNLPDHAHRLELAGLELAGG